MNVYQRINEIRKKVPYIKKDATVSGGGKYRAVTHDQVTSIVRPFFIEFGVVIVPRQTKGTLRDTNKSTSSGTPFSIYEAEYDIDFVNMDDPNDICTITVGSVAEDLSDKGPGKAISYATKYAVLKLMMIETGESDESRNPEQVPAEKLELTPESKNWKGAVDAYKRDGSFDNILKHVTMSEENKNKLKDEAAPEPGSDG